MAAKVWVSLVCESNLVPIEDVQFPVPEQFDSLSPASCSKLCRFGCPQFFPTKILSVLEEWFSSTLFHHISQECSVGLRQVYDTFQSSLHLAVQYM